jgi:hypothetical protein
MEYHLGQGMILCMMTAPLEVLLGLNHSQENRLVPLKILGNFHFSCLPFSALMVVMSKVFCKIKLLFLRLDLE